jgi:hypothetical protein
MSANQTHTAENKKTLADYRNLIPKITEVRQIHIISFWVTLVLFLVFILLIAIDFFRE